MATHEGKRTPLDADLTSAGSGSQTQTSNRKLFTAMIVNLFTVFKHLKINAHVSKGVCVCTRAPACVRIHLCKYVCACVCKQHTPWRESGCQETTCGSLFSPSTVRPHHHPALTSDHHTWKQRFHPLSHPDSPLPTFPSLLSL